jgi:hypothetical protein
MDRSGAVPVIISALLVGMGIGLIRYAPHIQRATLRMMGQPRNAFAARSHELAASRTTLQSIRATGAMCVAVGAVFALLVATR